MFSSTPASCLMFSMILAAMACPAAGAPRPNVVVILADDLGYGDLRCYDSKSKIPTPHLDALARGGVRFTDAHTPSSVCTPTRYGLLTGRYCWRTRLKSSVLDGFSPPLIEPERATLASLLREQGYQTGCIGKWHLGMQWTRNDGGRERVDRGEDGFRSGSDIRLTSRLESGPLTCGFGTFFGISASLDMPPYCWIEQDRCWPAPDTTVETARDTLFLNQTGGAAHSDFTLSGVLPKLQDRAVQWIGRHSGERPFFLYLPLTSPHLPVTPSDRFLSASGAGQYADFVMQTDAVVGAVVAELKRRGELEETLLLFTSDNGGLWHAWTGVERDDVKHYRPTPRGRYNLERGHRSNGAWRGTKADIWEGGHRVPLLAHWPARIQAGHVATELVELTDILATCVDVLELELPAGSGEDSFSFQRSLTAGAAPGGGGQGGNGEGQGAEGKGGEGQGGEGKGAEGQGAEGRSGDEKGGKKGVEGKRSGKKGGESGGDGGEGKGGEKGSEEKRSEGSGGKGRGEKKGAEGKVGEKVGARMAARRGAVGGAGKASGRLRSTIRSAACLRYGRVGGNWWRGADREDFRVPAIST